MTRILLFQKATEILIWTSIAVFDKMNYYAFDDYYYFVNDFPLAYGHSISIDSQGFLFITQPKHARLTKFRVAPPSE